MILVQFVWKNITSMMKRQMNRLSGGDITIQCNQRIWVGGGLTIGINDSWRLLVLFAGNRMCALSAVQYQWMDISRKPGPEPEQPPSSDGEICDRIVRRENDV